MSTNALLLLDYQEAICRGPIGQSSGLAKNIADKHVLERAARCLSATRAKNMAVAHVRVMFDADFANRLNRNDRWDGYEKNGLFVEGSAGIEFCEEVAPHPRELVVSKGCVDPFIGTALFEWLRGRNVDTLYMGGVATHMVVESAVRHASDCGFYVRVISDLCASHTDELHEYSMGTIIPLFARTMTSDEYLSAIG